MNDFKLIKEYCEIIGDDVCEGCNLLDSYGACVLDDTPNEWDLSQIKSVLNKIKKENQNGTKHNQN